MQVFELKDYRQAFGALFRREKERRPGWSISLLGERARIQPSYLTNVTKGRAHFSADQIYAIAAELQLKEDEAEYLALLMEWERSDQPQRKQKLERDLERLRGENLNAKKVIAAKEIKLSPAEKERYFLDPNVELLHLYVGTKNAATDPAEIARIWGFSVPYTEEILGFLQSTGLITKKGRRWQREPVHQHLPRESSLLRPQQQLRRLRIMEALQRARADRAYAFSATVTMTEDTRTQIQARFLEFLKDCEKLVRASEPEGVYHIQFDLFPWLEGK